jgi:hypothetical protein
MMDEKKLNTYIHSYIQGFKDSICSELTSETSLDKDTLNKFIQEYTPLTVSEEHFIKKKRVKNIIPFHDKCIAKRANSEQCSRRKKKDSEFCGTHIKACPHGVVTHDLKTSGGESTIIKKEVEVWLEDMNGIMYWINDSGTVYHPDDIHKNIENPRVIAHYEKHQQDGTDIYKIMNEETA